MKIKLGNLGQPTASYLHYGQSKEQINKEIKKTIKDLIFEIIMLLLCLMMIFYAWKRYDEVRNSPEFTYCIQDNINKCIDNE